MISIDMKTGLSSEEIIDCVWEQDLDPKGSNSTTDTTDCDKMKEDEMIGAYSMHGTGRKHIKCWN
jgi:hypothetical protein